MSAFRWLALWMCLLKAATCHGADWPQFQGPNRDAVSTETGLNWDWEQRPPKVRWKVPNGSGYSSLAIVGERLYTTAKFGPRDGVVCLDVTDGKQLWTYEAAPTYLDKQKHGPGPRSTPTVDGDRLYCLFAMGELVCLTTAGKKLWETNVFDATGARNPHPATFYWGVSYSPLVEGDLVIVQPGGDKNNSVAAFHRDTGKLVWTAGDDPVGYASPIAITVAGKRCVVCPTGSSMIGLEPTKGTILWHYVFGNKFNATAATPVWRENLLFVSAAYGAGSAVLELEPGLEKWAVREKWKDRKSLQNLMASSMILDGHVYGAHGDLSAFQVRCLELRTGKPMWSERASERIAMLAVDGHILLWGERGSLRAIKANPEAFTQVGELPDLLTYKAWAMPALADGRLYLRDEKHVLSLDLRKP